MSQLLIVCIVLSYAISIMTKTKYFLHMMQLEGYSSEKYVDWMENYKEKVHTKKDKTFVISMVVLTVLYLTLNKIVNFNFLILYAVAFIALAVMCLSEGNYEAKKPLVFTDRAKRLYMLTVLVVLVDLVITILIVYLLSKSIIGSFGVTAGILSIMYYFNSYYILAGNYLAKPIEKKVNKKFYDMACSKVRSINGLKTVGITGSYGKTSTKFITSTILDEKFKVLKTPESYNTPMGISKVINNDLNDNYEIFVAELGADQVGEIKEVAVLTNPSIGIITSIGPCHLQTFGSIENIMKTKYELIDELPEDGIAIFNYDNVYVQQLADKTKKSKIIYAVDNIETADIYATDIKVTSLGSEFKLNVKNEGSIDCKTKILGKHNILNLLAGASVGKALGMTLEQIRDGIAKVEPVEHRLQLIDPKTGVLVIDDAFNSNPDGAKAALDVLKSFDDRRKIIVTPGMIELGEIEYTENEKFGQNIADACDIAILIGKKRTEPIQNGITKHGFNKDNLFVVNTLDESSRVLASLTKSGDVVLFENDLPDTYNEN